MQNFICDYTLTGYANKPSKPQSNFWPSEKKFTKLLAVWHVLYMQKTFTVDCNFGNISNGKKKAKRNNLSSDFLSFVISMIILFIYFHQLYLQCFPRVTAYKFPCFDMPYTPLYSVLGYCQPHDVIWSQPNSADELKSDTSCNCKLCILLMFITSL
jgi:hypothetical protein